MHCSIIKCISNWTKNVIWQGVVWWPLAPKTVSVLICKSVLAAKNCNLLTEREAAASEQNGGETMRSKRRVLSHVWMESPPDPLPSAPAASRGAHIIHLGIWAAVQIHRQITYTITCMLSQFSEWEISSVYGLCALWMLYDERDTQSRWYLDESQPGSPRRNLRLN